MTTLHERHATQGAAADRSPFVFFGLVFALSLPFWWASYQTEVLLPANLPVAAVQVVVPLVVAAILLARREGWSAVRRLLHRTVDVSSIEPRRWLVPVLFLWPAMAVVAYAWMRLAGRILPDPQITVVAVVAALVVFFISAVGEEAGWTAYATDPLLARWGVLRAGLLIGSMWALWHLVSYLQVHSLSWALWQCVFTVASRVLMVWLYTLTGRSVAAVVLAHDLSNVAYALFPNNGSHYDPAFIGTITMVVATLIMVVERVRRRR